jgi:protein quaking
LFHWHGNQGLTRLPEPCGSVVSLSEKLFVPINEYPDYNFVGRILGPRGMTAKQLEMDTGCKIMVRGKGSMRDKVKEDQNRGKPNWEHLNEDLHVLITVEDTQNRAEIKLRRAVEEVKKLLVPTADGEDELKKIQLMELAIMNGTYRESLPQPGTAIAIINTPQGPRMIATQALGMPAVLQSPPTPVLQPSQLPAGTPIFLAPRLPHQLTSVASVPSPAVLGATSPMPSLVSAASMSSTSGLVYSYSYDPYVQRMFEYSTSLEPSVAGAVPKLRRTLAVREHPYSRGPLA